MKQKCLRLKVMIVVILNCFQLLYGMHGCENSSQLKCSIDQSPIVSEQKHWSLVPMNSVDHSNQGPTQIVEDLFAIITTPEKINRAPFSPIREAVNILSCDDKQRELILSFQKIPNPGLPSLQDPIVLLTDKLTQDIPVQIFSILLLSNAKSQDILAYYYQLKKITQALLSQPVQAELQHRVNDENIRWDKIIFHNMPAETRHELGDIEARVKSYFGE